MTDKNQVSELTATMANNLRSSGTKGRHRDGVVRGLYLHVRGVGVASWLFRKTIAGKRTDLGLGSYPEITISMARARARAIIQKLDDGTNPIEEKRQQLRLAQIERAKLVTFAEVAKEFIAIRAKEYKTPKQTQKLTNYLEGYANPIIGNMVVADIEKAHVLQVIKPIWEVKNETANRVRNAIERVLNKATSDGLREGLNPARWAGNMQESLPKPSKIHKVKHHAALPYVDAPDFMAKLKNKKTTSAYCLQFIILTAARSGEARAATWEQIDFEAATWTIPAEVMKMDRPHIVPLSKEVLAMLCELPQVSRFVFANKNEGKLSDVAVSKVAKELGGEITVHGFRSTFKDWSRTSTSYPDEVSELALAHVNNDATRAAYARDMLLNKRKLLMADWAKYCHQGAGFSAKGGNKVTKIRQSSFI